MSSLDLSVLEIEIQLVYGYLLIANFIGPRPKFDFMEPLDGFVES